VIRTSINTMPAELREANTRYRCHKVVRALKIDQVIPTVNERDRATWCILCFAQFPQAGEQLQIEYNTSQKPIPSAGWYWVLYDDGYESFSPPEAFESGYARLVQVTYKECGHTLHFESPSAADPAGIYLGMIQSSIDGVGYVLDVGWCTYCAEQLRAAS
jgi:hypothetical protein